MGLFCLHFFVKNDVFNEGVGVVNVVFVTFFSTKRFGFSISISPSNPINPKAERAALMGKQLEAGDGFLEIFNRKWLKDVESLSTSSTRIQFEPAIFLK